MSCPQAKVRHDQPVGKERRQRLMGSVVGDGHARRALGVAITAIGSSSDINGRMGGYKDAEAANSSQALCAQPLP